MASYEKTDFSKTRTALATVVRVQGSSYRSVGARMLMTEDGQWTGSISGGCLEGDALRKARKAIRSESPMVVRYDTMDDENNSFGLGLGCNGIIDILIEPINPTKDNNPVALLKDLAEITESARMATLIMADASNDLKPGMRYFILPGSEPQSDFINTSIEGPVAEALEKAEMSGVQLVNHPGGSVEVFMELIPPPIHLVIYGAGFDARPLAKLASYLGWNVTVTDECVAHLLPVFFPDASLKFCERNKSNKEIQLHDYTAAVIMSHGYDYDLAALKSLLPSKVPYIGLLGPKKRFEKMQKTLGAEIKPKDLNRVHNPIGLDIGAETPEEIAFAIISEIKARFNYRSGGFLKYRTGPIHQRDAESDQVFKHIYLSGGNSKSRSL